MFTRSSANTLTSERIAMEKDIVNVSSVNEKKEPLCQRFMCFIEAVTIHTFWSAKKSMLRPNI